ncbi:MAG: hypothetical protein PHZ00_07360 [Candidatus Peribacteraceae bacterium]|nr:hypothetical protein [Candidatus Peribacteraceae bacterium]
MNDPKTQKRRNEEPRNLATFLGRSYALVQHGMDKVIEWGFARMQDVSKEKEQEPAAEPERSTLLHGIAKTGRGVIRFFGVAGKSYYRYYEELKARNRSRKGEK